MKKCMPIRHTSLRARSNHIVVVLALVFLFSGQQIAHADAGYRLPWTAGEAWYVAQGWNGSYTSENLESASNSPQICTISANTKDSMGTVFSAGDGDRIRVDLKIHKPDHILVNSKIAYLWTDSKNKGMKFGVKALPLKEFPSITNFECQKWTPDNSIFVPPANIDFINTTKEMLWRRDAESIAVAVLTIYLNSYFENRHKQAIVTEVSPQRQTPRACMFYAPNPKNVYELIGHVGWGFRDGAGDKWVFGATEFTNGRDDNIFDLGPQIKRGIPDNTQSWQKTGNWAQVLWAFGTGENFDRGPNYYQTYRCIDIKTSDPVIAKKQADVGQRSGYDWRDDNCLTKSVDILSAYGVTNLPPASYGRIPVRPPDYFSRLLPSGFDESPQPLVPPNWLAR